ncbi:MAG: tetratricopeptide repeat protein, partial [Rhodospirillaceae bacterium]|nr:tetratricopeptide repeat protein [Rhodospirillaceae bacterium]
MSLRDVLRRLTGQTATRKEIAIKVNDVGTTLAQKGLLDEAIINFSSAIELDPQEPSFWSNLGNALNFSGQTEAACQCFEKGSKLKGAPAHLFDNWGTALTDAGRLHDALEAHKKAVSIDPGMADALSNLGNTYRAIGRLDDALMNLDAAAALSPASRTIASSRLYTMNFLETISPEDIARAHLLWPGADSRRIASFANAPMPDRVLRIGYVSSDFRHHSCANFLLPLIEHHDRHNVHVTAFSGVQAPDEFTERFRSSANDWVDVALTSDEEFCAEVSNRSIDILVDCGGHTSSTRLASFALRAAPIQVSWLGYPHTTGLQAMDARLTDSVGTPSEMEGFFSETLVPLPNGFHTYRPLQGSEIALAPPCVTAGHVTFGAFHNLAKISDTALGLWASVLSSVSNSRLKIKAKSFVDSRVQADFEARCVRAGIDKARLETHGWRSREEDHFSDFNDVDIVLDATPYNGTTTTCEALWMGVPVVTLCGDRPAGRVGASLLTQIDHREWIAETNDDYIRIASDLAGEQS